MATKKNILTWRTLTKYLVLCLVSIVLYRVWIIIPYGTFADNDNAETMRQRNRITRKWCQWLYTYRDQVDPSFKDINAVCTSSVKIDIVIAVIDKDIVTLNHLLDSIQTHVMHPIGKIYLIAPPTPTLQQVAITKGCVLVPEETVLDNFATIKAKGGWVLQQFLKLSADKIVEQEHFLVVDADTVFLRPQIFINQHDDYLVNLRWDYRHGAKRLNALAFNIKHQFILDFVCHHLLMSKKILTEMKQAIADIHHQRWDEALLHLISQDKNLSLSEYELYVTFLLDRYWSKTVFVSSANISYYRDRFDNFNEIKAALAGQFKSLSSHNYILFEPKPAK